MGDERLAEPVPDELKLIELPEEWSPEQRAEFRKTEQILHWEDLTAKLKATGRFQDIDKPALISVCKVYGWLRLAEVQLAIQGMTTIQHTGYGANIIPNPIANQYRALVKEHRLGLEAFGLTPKGRGKPKAETLTALGNKKKGSSLASFHEQWDRTKKDTKSRKAAADIVNARVKAAKRKPKRP